MKLWKYTFYLLLLLLTGVIIALFQLPDQNLHIIACDVGQGDAILITYKDSQILTDGGPNSKVLTCLGRHMPFWDRSIELIVSTHPETQLLIFLLGSWTKYAKLNIYQTIQCHQ